LACDGQTTVGAEMKLSEVRGLHPVEIRNIRGEAETAILEMRFRRILVRPPRDKEKKYPELVLTAIYAQERGTPKRSERASLSPSQTRTTRSSSLGWSLMSDTSSSTRPTFALFHARGDEERAPERDRPSDLHLPEI
jgi:hypothetical protein